MRTETRTPLDLKNLSAYATQSLPNFTASLQFLAHAFYRTTLKQLISVPANGCAAILLISSSFFEVYLSTSKSHLLMLARIKPIFAQDIEWKVSESNRMQGVFIDGKYQVDKDMINLYSAFRTRKPASASDLDLSKRNKYTNGCIIITPSE